MHGDCQIIALECEDRFDTWLLLNISLKRHTVEAKKLETP